MHRRNFLITAGASLAASRAVAARTTEPGVTDTEILLGQSAVLSGPISPGLLASQGGAKLAFGEVNAQNGVAGRRIRLMALDDAFDAAKAQANYTALVQEHQVFACFMGTGGVNALAGLQVLHENNVPLFGAIGVGDSVRDKTLGVAYYTRASQQREADALVQHLSTLGMRRVSVAYLATPGGKEVLGQLEEAIKKHGLQLLGSAGIAPDGSNVPDAAKTLAVLPAQATIMFLTGPAGAGVMKGIWANGGAPAFYGMSILAGDVTAKLINDPSRGLAVSQVTAYPWDSANADSNKYRQACEKAQVPVGYHSYEGYISARVLIEALRQTGRDLTRARLHATMKKLKTRVAGMDYDFSGGQHTGSRFIELVRVRPDGKYVR